MSLQERRENIVRRHTDSENRHRFDETLETFGHPRYEVVPTGEVFDGSEAVAHFLAESDVAFPDFSIRTTVLHHAADAVIAEVEFEGTHLGPWRGLPATGRRVKYKMCNVFVFEDDRLVCERLYFDLMSVLRQVGVAHDPTSTVGRIATIVNHPVTIARALIRLARGPRPEAAIRSSD